MLQRNQINQSAQTEWKIGCKEKGEGVERRWTIRSSCGLHWTHLHGDRERERERELARETAHNRSRQKAHQWAVFGFSTVKQARLQSFGRTAQDAGKCWCCQRRRRRQRQCESVSQAGSQSVNRAEAPVNPRKSQQKEGNSRIGSSRRHRQN